MLTTALNDDGFTGSILIEPNRPISWSANMRFIGIFSVISFSIGLFFMSQGFLLVLPYSGLEVVALSSSLYYAYSRYTTCQVIYFTIDSVIIESGDKKADTHVEYKRHWSVFIIDKKNYGNIPKLSILSKGKSTEIGPFLNSKDKAELISLIKQLTLRFIAA